MNQRSLSISSILENGVLLPNADLHISDFHGISFLGCNFQILLVYSLLDETIGVYRVAVNTLPEIRDVVSRLAAQYGAKRVYLFGSYARGDMTSSSDIDLRIDKGAIQGLEMAGLLVDLEDALGTPVDLIPTGSLDDSFLSAIQNDEVLLYESI